MFCPHCNSLLAAHEPASATRCRACRLVIGPGRALRSQEDGRTGSTGGASGRLANAALREGADPGDPRVVTDALRRVARDLDVLTARLRLYDYEGAHRVDATSPSVAVVLATFGTWKRAREVAADELAPDAP